MLGEILRRERKMKQYTMAEVASMVGVTTGYISNLEKNRLEPSLTLLRDLSEKLGIPASLLMAEDLVETVTIVRHDKRPCIHFGNLPFPCEVLTPLNWHGPASDELESIQIALTPGNRFDPAAMSRDTDLCVYMLYGEAAFQYADNRLTLNKDDSLFIPRNTSCNIENTGSEDAVLILLTKTLASIQSTVSDVVKERPNMFDTADFNQFQLLGERIRSLRKSHGSGINTFAAAVGVTPAYISQIERNMTEPSLRVLRSIARALNVELTLLFARDMPADVLVTRSGQRDEMTIADGNTHFQLMMPYHTVDGRSPDMSIVHVRIEGGRRDSEESIIHDYDEFCLVLEGQVEYHTPQEVYSLNTGDCLYMRKGVPHTLRNPGESETKLLAVLGSVFRRQFK